MALLAGQVERDGLGYVSGTCAGTLLQQEGDEVCPTVQGSNVQWGDAVLVGHIHTEPTGGDLCQLLEKAEDGGRGVSGIRGTGLKDLKPCAPHTTQFLCKIWDHGGIQNQAAHRELPTTIPKE